jgi:hypothetical protein
VLPVRVRAEYVKKYFFEVAPAPSARNLDLRGEVERGCIVKVLTYSAVGNIGDTWRHEE